MVQKHGVWWGATGASIVAAVSLGCSGTPPPASPAAADPPPTAKGPPAVTRVAGVVLFSATKAPPATGGVVYIEDAPKQPGVATSATVDVTHKVFSPTSR